MQNDCRCWKTFGLLGLSLFHKETVWICLLCKIFLDVIVVIITVYTTDMSLSEVHLCIMSAMLMRTVFGIGSASIHTPSLRCTCSTMFIQLYTVGYLGIWTWDGRRSYDGGGTEPISCHDRPRDPRFFLPIFNFFFGDRELRDLSLSSKQQHKKRVLCLNVTEERCVFHWWGLWRVFWLIY